MIVVDYSYDRPSMQSLKMANVESVCRYLAPTPHQKVITPSEVDALMQSKIGLVLNWENKAGDALRGAAGGASDAHMALQVMRRQAPNYPPGHVIIGSCDFDVNRAQWLASCGLYYKAFASIIRDAGYHPGLYGSWDALQWAYDDGSAEYFWQAGMSKAWSQRRNNAVSPHANLFQQRGATIGGAAVDINVIVTPSYGAWMPWEEETVGKTGSSIRPPGSDSYWPPVGTRVNWRLAQPIQDCEDQGKAIPGYVYIGDIGNESHLRAHGGHTPWRPGSTRGVIWALDCKFRDMADFERWLVATCRSSYDTSWISFFNINGKQYDGVGNYIKASSDQHLHLEVKAGYQDKRVTLFRDYAQGDEVVTPEDIAKIAKAVAEVRPFPHPSPRAWITFAGSAGQTYLYLAPEGEIRKKIDDIKAKLDSLPATPEIDYVALAKALIKELSNEQT